MALDHHFITRDKNKEILREKMTSSLFIQIDNPNLNIVQDNEAINKVVPPFLNLVLANINKDLTNEIQTNCTIKGDH